MRIKLMIAEEQKIAREGLCALFKAETDMEVLGEAEVGEDVVAVTARTMPDVVLMGVDISRLEGVGEALERMRQIALLAPSVRVIGLSDGDVEGQVIRDLLAAGAAGFLTRTNGFSDLLAAVRLVMTKRIYLSPDVAEVMVDQYVLRPMTDKSAAAALTPREREVLQLVCEGMSTKEAASTLKISGKTVDMHRQNIMNKLSIHSVAELTKYAIREGITALNV